MTRLSIVCPVYQFVADIVVLVGIDARRTQKVGEEKELQNKEQDKQFQKNNQPQRSPESHLPKAGDIETENLLQPSPHTVGLKSLSQK